MYQWLENKLSRLLVMSNKSHKSTLHQKKTEKVDIENVIVEWILINWSLGVSISSWEVIIKVF